MSGEIDKCDVVCINHEAVSRVMDIMLDENTARDMADTFKILGDPNRVKIVHCLSSEELCVCDIAQVLGMSTSAVSHQLRALRDRRLVKFRRDGKIVYYSLDDDHIVSLFNQCRSHVKHD
ncbi:MAG: transcriptional regulator [Firmicutes bacterium HGW-Firmicutes-14]|nr:MAG: transcriptional regulator [Firmicutes bacterium HGW-Firmicutes-14]